MTDHLAVHYLSNIYDETYDLLLETRHYMRSRGMREWQERELKDRVHLTQNALQLTSWLGFMMSWLLTQKAMQSGEITRKQAALPENRLPGGMHFEEYMAGIGELPHDMQQLMWRSQKLYKRMSRLDAMFGQLAAAD